jgi:hypothetical protein
MKLISRSFKAFLSVLMIITLTVSFSGCSSSNSSTSSDTNTKVNQPTPDNKEQGTKTEPTAAKDFEKLLTAADVEQISGIKGVKIIPYNPQIGAGGKLNFAVEDDKPILAVMVQDEAMFNRWKEDKNLNAAVVSDLGDKAFKGVADSNMYTPNVTFIKGKQAIQLFTFFNLNNDMKPYMNHDQLIKLAKIIEGRM